jgi:pimeloyl-ACP methyl ester carboxylesterase
VVLALGSSSLASLGTLGKVAIGLLGVILALAGTGAVYQAIGSSLDRANFAPPGDLIDVGGHRLHLHCAGPLEDGGPTVILEAGAGMASPIWAWVQTQVDDTTRVCSYDRAGYGWSNVGPLPRDAKTIAAELHALLESAAIAGPLILVGHSIGGVYTRVYARLYPEDVVGMVLVDSSHPDQLRRSPALKAAQDRGWQVLRLAPMLARLGVLRITGMLNSPFDGLPNRQHDEMSAFLATPLQLETTLAELMSWESSATQARSSSFRADMPLAVVSATVGSLEGLLQLQVELAELSQRGALITVEGASHTSLLSNEAHAALTAAAILNVVAAVEDAN